MKKEIKLNGITDLTNDLKNLYEDCRNEKVDIRNAKEIANVAGKLIKSAALKMEYNSKMGNNSKVEFLEN